MAQAQFELMQSLQLELIHMRKSQEDRFDAMMRKPQKHDEALASFFLGQQTLLEQMREDKAHNDYQFAYIFNKTGMLPPVPMPPNTQPLSHFSRPMLCDNHSGEMYIERPLHQETDVGDKEV
jgi:hypothetical protein